MLSGETYRYVYRPSPRGKWPGRAGACNRQLTSLKSNTLLSANPTHETQYILKRPITFPAWKWSTNSDYRASQLDFELILSHVMLMYDFIGQLPSFTDRKLLSLLLYRVYNAL